MCRKEHQEFYYRGNCKIEINDNEGSKNYKMSYGYDQKLLKEYGNIFPSINQKKSNTE